MIAPPLLHARTKTQLELYLAHPNHALILAGPVGVGKKHVALWLSDQLNIYHHIIERQEKLSAITIEQIRELYNVTRSGSKQMIIISDAELMNSAAQNAFLKLLEEPPANSAFILTVNNDHRLLPTIRSRSTTIQVLPPTIDAFTEYTQKNDADFIRLVRSSGNLPGNVFARMHNSAEWTAYQAQLEETKHFYSSNAYARHKMLISHNYERGWSMQLLQSLARIIDSLIEVRATDRTSLERMTRQASLVQMTLEAIEQKPGNPKIHLTKLAEML